MSPVVRDRDCPLAGCDGQRGRAELLCPAHWHQVPRAERGAVWHAFRHHGVLSEQYEAAVTAAFASLGYDADGAPVP